MKSFAPARLALFVAIAFSLCFAPLPVLAQSIPDPTANLGPFLTFLLDAVQGKQWGVAGAALGIGIVAALKWGGVKLPGALGAFFASSRGGAILALGTALATGLGAAVVSHTPITISLVLNLLLQGFGMIGGWVGVRRILAIDVASKAQASFAAGPPGSARSVAGELGKPPIR